jgi:hypothetical protein
VFDHTLSNFARLADNVQQASARYLLPKLEAECQRGAAEFGPLAIAADGIHHGGQRHRWKKIEYSVSRGYLVIVPAGDDFGWSDRVEIALMDIPNVLVLLELMAGMGKPPVDPLLVVPRSDRARMSRLPR